jgi:DMSO/TMAO reductase YedYZ molybdopterin-dependent catalytic subunit
MESRRWLTILGTGFFAGLVASVLMTLLMALLRTGLGVATPAELIGDRLVPTLTIEAFFRLFHRFGGYNQLKQVGVISVLAGQLAVGALGGVLYAFVVERQRLRTLQPTGPLGSSRGGLRCVALFVGVLWLTTLGVLWPVLGTHYGGLPPGRATVVTTLGLLFSYAGYGCALLLAYGMSTRGASSGISSPLGQPLGRRAVLVGGLGGMAAVAAYALLRRLYQRATFSYDGTRYSGPDLQPMTPNDRFYVVTKNVIDPCVHRSVWRLEVRGLVKRPQTYRYEDLVAMLATTQETTLECISNIVGGGLMSNAMWTGVPMRRLIEAARPRPGVVKVLLHAADGYTDTLAFEKAMDPTTLVVYEMNGAPLPERHGYPVRIIVPGLFGEKNVKWVTQIELVNYNAKGFYERQGWGPNFVIPTCSRFDQPYDGQQIRLALAAATPLKGVAFAGTRGVQRVEISLDNGRTWHEAKIDYTGSPMAWVLWSYDWRPTQPGEYKLAVRATDGMGVLQTPEERSPSPEGATGYHRVSALIEA